MRIVKRIAPLFLVFFLALFVVSSSVRAEGDQCNNAEGTQCESSSTPLTNPLGASTFEGLLENIVNWLITIATPIAVGMMLIGAFQMIFAGGNPERFAAGKKTILYTAIGYAIIVVGWGMVSIIRDVLNVQ